MNSQQVKEELQEQLKFQDEIGTVIIEQNIAEFVTLRDEQVNYPESNWVKIKDNFIM